MQSIDQLAARVKSAEKIWLFLDYDGTLADFSPTPAFIEPQPDVIELLERLKDHSRFRVAVISGRRLNHLEKLVPIPGLLLAGTYGIELCTEDGQRIERLPFDQVRPSLERLKPAWESLISVDAGYYLEDKGWALAIHARHAEDDEAVALIAKARETALNVVNLETFRILGGHKFIEVAPIEANKGRTLEYLFHREEWGGGLKIYIGDDDKDEEAFKVVKLRGGFPIVVSTKPRITEALYRLESPKDVHFWLESLLEMD